jgi:hypothetical protein
MDNDTQQKRQTKRYKTDVNQSATLQRTKPPKIIEKEILFPTHTSTEMTRRTGRTGRSNREPKRRNPNRESPQKGI